MSNDYRGLADTDADFEAKAARAAKFMVIEKKRQQAEAQAQEDILEALRLKFITR